MWDTSIPQYKADQVTLLNQVYIYCHDNLKYIVLLKELVCDLLIMTGIRLWHALL